MKIAVAQVPSIKGDVETNICTHLNSIDKAGQLGISYLVFPELSLTGYEPELAASLAFTADDSRLQPLIESAVANKLHVVVGAPLKTDRAPHIAAFVISPLGCIDTYSKMNLHSGEQAFFSAGKDHHFVTVDGIIIGNAICADTNNSHHAQACADFGADVYIAGVMFSEAGYAADTRQLEYYARKLKMLVAMANYNQPTGGWLPIGKSAIWTDTGLLAMADEKQDALVIAEHSPSGWTGCVVDL
ncbi:MAG: carbon-nitrogen hydrolase family protein [Amphritea sp.]